MTPEQPNNPRSESDICATASENERAIDGDRASIELKHSSSPRQEPCARGGAVVLEDKQTVLLDASSPPDKADAETERGASASPPPMAVKQAEMAEPGSAPEMKAAVPEEMPERENTEHETHEVPTLQEMTSCTADASANVQTQGKAIPEKDEDSPDEASGTALDREVEGDAVCEDTMPKEDIVAREAVPALVTTAAQEETAAAEPDQGTMEIEKSTTHDEAPPSPDLKPPPTPPSGTMSRSPQVCRSTLCTVGCGGWGGEREGPLVIASLMPQW